MLDLFIDIGNSRVKLACTDGKDYEYLGAFPVSIAQQPETLIEQLATYQIEPHQVYIASVSEGSIYQAVSEAVTNAWQLLPVTLHTQTACCGIENGYDDPHKLGVDRWMAMIGAGSLLSGPFIVIDAGTAITVDAVAEGRHLGGFIVPGIRSMRNALSGDAAQIDVSDEADINQNALKLPKGLAKDTGSAIYAGTLYMASAYLNTLIQDLKSTFNQRFEVVITGGDGALISGLMNGPVDRVDDLVLLGMVEVKEGVKNS